MSRAPPADPWRFRPHIEGLRAVAIIGVILFHAGVQNIPGGFLGVDVFFVISGFLITGILLEEVRLTGTVSLAAFWARRARRLLPAATLVCLATLLLSLGLDAPFVQANHARSALSFASYWSNLRFMVRGADYFDHTSASDPFLHTWSLGVEEQYYLVFAPLVLWLAWSVRRQSFSQFRWRLLECVVAISIASFAGCLLLTAVRPLIAFYALPARAWEFGLGALVALRLTQGAQKGSRFDGAILLVALAVVIAASLVADSRTANRGPLTLLLAVGTAVLIQVGGRGPTLVGRLLETPIMRWLGRLSYSWYLWHWPIAVYWSQLVPKPISLMIGMPLLSLALAQLTYVAIEAPARRTLLPQSPRRALLAALVLALGGTAAGLIALQVSRQRVRDPAYAFILEARRIKTRMQIDGCQLTPTDIRLSDCSYGDPASATTVVLFGDSHAARWFPALERVIAERAWRLVPMTKSGCPSVAVPVWRKSLGRAYTECGRWRENVFERLAVLQPSLVLISNSYWHDVVGAPPAGVILAPPPAQVWRRGLQTTLERLPRTAAVLLLEDVPYPKFDVPACLFEHVHEIGRCAFDRDSALTPELSEVEREAGRRNPRVTYLDLTDWICDRLRCPGARGDTAVYSDTDHLSVRFAASLSPWLLPTLDAILTPRRIVATRNR